MKQFNLTFRVEGKEINEVVEAKNHANANYKANEIATLRNFGSHSLKIKEVK